MALVSAGFRLTVTLLDNSGNDTTLQYQLRAGNAEDAGTDSVAILTALGNVSDGEIASYTISQDYVENALALPASSAQQAEVSASLTSLLAGAGNKKGNFRIPMPKTSVFTATTGTGANVVNTSDAGVIAYHNLFKSTGKAYLSDGENAGDLVGGVRVTRAKRGG